jgi:spermidine synthase
MQLLDSLVAAPEDLGGWPADGGDTDAARRFAAYWRARDAFLRAGVGVEPTDDARALLAQTRRPLLEAVRMSPDFAAAYDPLLRLAEAVAPGDPDAARLLLAELEAANPVRREAAAVRRRLFGSE